MARRLAGPVPLPADLPVPWKLLLSGMLDHRPDQRLGGDEVAALLRTMPFRAPWTRSRSPVTDRMAPTVPNDLTALAPGAGATAILGPVSGADDTRTSPPRVSGALRNWRWRLAVLGAVVLAALCVGLILGLGSSPKAPTTPSAIDPTTSKTRPPATSTTSTTTSTTTTLPSGPTALAALVKDVASGVSAGSVDSGSGQSISNQAEQAIADEASGNAESGRERSATGGHDDRKRRPEQQDHPGRRSHAPKRPLGACHGDRIDCRRRASHHAARWARAAGTGTGTGNG